MESPIIFISNEEDRESGRLKIHEKAANMIANLPKPLAVITIAGLYRTGKSFILNQLAGKTSGFNVGASVEPCTQGIWMWIVKTEDLGIDLGNIKNILLLDTEGLGSYTKTASHDIKIFTLSALLSSYFIYNSMGAIDDTAFDNLRLLLELANTVRNSKNQNESTSDIASHFPKFMWLLRDFVLDLFIDGQQISPNEYLEKTLAPLTGNSEDVASKNRVRHTVKEYFRDRRCFTLKRPVNDEEKLQEIDKLKREDFRPEYLEQVDILLKQIYAQVTPKQVNGNLISGAVLIDLANSYIKALNEGGIPVIQSSWQFVVGQRCKQMILSGDQTFSAQFEEKLAKEPLDLDNLISIHVALKNTAIQSFRLNASTFGEFANPYLEELESCLEQRFETIKAKNNEMSEISCRKAMSLFEENVRVSSTSVEFMFREFRSEFQKYLANAKGPFKYPLLTSNLLDILDPILTAHANEIEQVREAAEAEKREAINKANAEYKTLKSLFDSVEAERRAEEQNGKTLRDEKNKLTMELGQLKRAIQALEDQNKTLSQDKLDLNGRLSRAEANEEQVKKIQDDQRMKLESGTEEISKLKTSIALLEKENQAMKEVASKKGCCLLQ